MVKARLTDPRYDEPRPSLGRLTEKIGVHTTTVSRMVRGTAATDPATVQAVADALGLSAVLVSQWVNQARTVREPYKMPSEVHLLDEREQAALSELIRAMAAAKESDQRGDTTPTKQADDDFLSASSASLPLEPEQTARPQPGAQSGRPAQT